LTLFDVIIVDHSYADGKGKTSNQYRQRLSYQ
jgi:hypothetical protein